MLIKVTDRIYLDSRLVKSLCLYETFRGREYSVCAEEFTLGKFDTEEAAQAFMDRIAAQLNEANRRDIA